MRRYAGGGGTQGIHCRFYKYGFVGVMLDWIDRGMKDDYHKIVEELAITLYGNISRSIENFEQTEKAILK